MVTMLLAVLGTLTALAVGDIDDAPAQPLAGWAATYWADGQAVKERVDVAALDVRGGGSVHAELPAGAFGASFASELPVDAGARLRFRLDAQGGRAVLVVRDVRRSELGRAEAAGGDDGAGSAATDWIVTEAGTLVLELAFEGGTEGASLALALEPYGAAGLAGCVVPEVFRNELEPAADPEPAPDDEPRVPRVLLFTQSSGYEHGVVKRPGPDDLAHAELHLRRTAADRYQFRVSQDATELPESLPLLDAVIFYTTGELPLTPEQRQDLLDWVAAGGAFVGVHCASDTMYAFPPYLDMVGGAFDGHPWHQQVTLDVEWPEHPSVKHLGPTWTLTDEIYQFRDFGRYPNQVLLSVSGDMADLSKGKREDGDYASAWCKPYGKGRVFYTALGHRPELFMDEGYLRHLFGGLDWALHGPDLPPPPPAGATVLVGPDGPDRTAWSHRDGGPFRWTALDGAMQVGGGAGDLVSRRAFGDALIHLEFRLPTDHEGRGNSGVYLQGRYEVQIIDPTTAETPDLGTCGAVYQVAAPARDAIRLAGEWQTYDIRFRAARFGAGDEKTEPARLSLWHNGILVHDDLELPGVTPGGLADSEIPVGPLLLQDHGDPVRYRNVWVAPLDR
jgi:type 1 glutamine amidotransferase